MMRRAIGIILTPLLLCACSGQPSALPFLDSAHQWWQTLTLTFERLVSPEEVAKREAHQHLETATRLIEQFKNDLADDQLDQARAALEQLLPLKASLPVDFQQDIARLEAMFADQPPLDI